MDDEFVDTSDFPDPVIYPTVTHSIPPSCLAHNPLTAKSYRNDLTTEFSTHLASPGTSISATVPWLRVEDWNMLKICSPVIIYYIVYIVNFIYSYILYSLYSYIVVCSYMDIVYIVMDIVGCGWKMMSPTVRFKAYHCLKRSDLKSRKIWGKDGPCSTWPSLDSLQTGTVQPFRGWIQVFSPNHPPKKVLAVAGYQW